MTPILFVLITAVCVSKTEGKVPNLGGTWNRPFQPKTLTVEDFVTKLAWRVGNVTSEKGLDFKPKDFSFQVSETLLGLSLKGNIAFKDGIVTEPGSIVPSVYAPYANRSTDQNIGNIYLAVRLNQLETIHDLETELETNNMQGSVETLMKNVDLFFELQHTFQSGENVVIPDIVSFLEDDVTWTIKPRNAISYVIETSTKRSNTTNLWFKNAIETWQKDVLVPLLVQETQNLPFPLDPN